MATLAGFRVFIVEDEALLLLALQDLLADLGCEVTAIAAQMTKAIDLARNVDCNAAVLDINIGNERIDAVADILAQRGIPFIFATGYGGEGLPLRHQSAPLIEKPYDGESLRSALTLLLET
jgi:CheY-like chemotaxis protein